jgi:hypothetical protein
LPFEQHPFSEQGALRTDTTGDAVGDSPEKASILIKQNKTADIVNNFITFS